MHKHITKLMVRIKVRQLYGTGQLIRSGLRLDINLWKQSPTGKVMCRLYSHVYISTYQIPPLPPSALQIKQMKLPLAKLGERPARAVSFDTCTGEWVSAKGKPCSIHTPWLENPKYLIHCSHKRTICVQTFSRLC